MINKVAQYAIPNIKETGQMISHQPIVMILATAAWDLIDLYNVYCVAMLNKYKLNRSALFRPKCKHMCLE